jgi:hypothetical protein
MADGSATRHRFGDEAFKLGLQAALAYCRHHTADAGEVLATASRIEDGDPNSWLDEWMGTAGAVWSAAAQAERSGRRDEALARYRRAATYYALAMDRIFHSSEPSRQLNIWRRQRACWERVVDLCTVPGERVDIPYEHTTLPGFFFPAADAVPGERRPLVVVSNGLDVPTSQMWACAGAAASERGYHWMTFDGPGQEAALYEQGIPSRPDWEAVLTPVLDMLLLRPDVDPQRVAVIGLGQGGYWVPRALCFEHRFAAAVADPGVVDVSTAWTGLLGEPMRAHLDGGRQEPFDRELHLVELFSPVLAATLNAREQPYGLNTGSRFKLFQAVSAYRLGDETSQITTPLLITCCERERCWHGQSQQLYDRLRGPRALIHFSAGDAADPHGELLGPALREKGIFDWLEQYMGFERGDDV